MNRPTPENAKELDSLISTPTDAVIETVRRHSGEFAVLGAGGKMGFHLCLMLQRALKTLERTERVRAVSRFRSVRSREEFENAGFEVHAADLSQADQLDRLPDTPNVFFIAGVKFGTSQDPALLQQMNVEMPRLAARRFRDSRIVAMSTGCVYSFCSPESGGSTEASETKPPGDYANSTKGREQAFFDAATDFGTRSALIRLNYSIDLRYGVLLDIAQKVLADEPIDVTTGHVNVIWQGDALAHTILGLDHVAAPPFVLNVTGPNVLSVRDLANSFGERFGRDVTFVGEEAPAAWLSNAAKAHSLFGPPDVSVEQMIAWIADWLERGGELLGKPTHFENREGKY